MSAASTYVLGSSEPEIQRLLLQCELLEPQARELLARIHVRPGWRTVDIGCGALGILNLLAETVGSSTEVVGLECDSRLLAAANQAMTKHRLDKVTLVQADARRTGLPRSAFDLAHARLVLCNVPEPEQVVVEMVDIVRPGGWVALQEIDWYSWICDPPHPAWTRLLELNETVWRSRGMDVHVGRRLPRMLRETGLLDIEYKVHARVWRHDDVYQNLLLAFAEINRGEMTGQGLITAQEWNHVTSSLGMHLADPATFVIDALFCQAWGRKPIR